MFLQPTNGFDRGVPGVLCWTEAAAEARMLDLAPDDLIATEADLREQFAAPGRLATLKQLDRLDHNCRRFIELSPFLCLATARPDGLADNSPRGDAPGFVQVLDERTLLIPDRPGNNRLDSMTNIVHNPNVGLLFFIPGVTETLRVNGRAKLITSRDLLARFEVRGRAPEVAILVQVVEAFLHCSKALIRSRLWEEDARVDRTALPSLGRMIADAVDRQSRPETVAEYDRIIERNIAEQLY
jgi:PPOX class probable FMN-dependent enzyme